MQHFRELADRGESCEFNNLMTAVEDSALKKLLVDLDERAAEKETLAHEDAAARLRQTLDTLARQSEDREHRDKLAELEEGKVSDQDAVAFLNDLVERNRKRQGIPAPTDG